MLVINLTNIVLDLFFVLVLNMDVDGVAAASVIAEIAGLVVGLVFAFKLLKTDSGPFPVFKANVLRRIQSIFCR